MRPVLLLCLALSGCALGRLTTVRSSHPAPEARHTSEAVAAPVQIHRDGLGVPHIRAATRRDALAGLGFVHAQDRVFQADLMRRMAFGELSPLVGDGAARLDRFMQGLQLRDRARRNLEALPEDVQDEVQAYVDGFNAGIASLPELPIEHRLLGAELPPWTAEDVLATPLLQSWNLAENPNAEAFALLMRDRLRASDADDLFRLSGEGVPTEAAWNTLRETQIAPFSPGYRAFTGALGGRPAQAEASNHWIVSGEHSADGKPILANDPHLGQSVPSLWYVADIQGGDWHVAGATLPGVPGVVIGHNGSVAWGLTNVMTDSVDLAVVRRDGPDAVIVAGQRERLRPVTVSAAGEEDIVWWTSIGPVVSTLEGARLVVLRWHALDMEDTSIEGFLRLSEAETVDEAVAAFAGRPMAIAQNLALADTAGSIAIQQVGGVVQRAGFSGRVPHDASSTTASWTGFQEELPGWRDPESGLLWNANHKPDHPLATFGAAYVPPWRAGRIEALLEQESARYGAGLTAEDLHRMQLDWTANRAADQLDGLLEGVVGTTPAARQCQLLLADWDRQMDPDSVGAAVWAVFQRELAREAVRDELGDDGASLYMGAASSGRSVLDSPAAATWIGDRRVIVDAALDATCDWLTDHHGKRPERWTWGKLHPLQLEHPFARGRRLLKRWNMEPVPWGGDGATVNAAGHSWRRHDLRVGGMASLRIVMPLGDLSETTLVHPGGQSGMPRHPTYASHYGAFVAGERLPLWTAEADVARETVATVELVPER